MPDRLGPAAALERTLLPSLERPPCLVSFSGGRDSSLVLAAAARAARRHGLPLPVPATLRFRDVPAAEESSWQERVVGHLRLGDWVRAELGDELDWIGPRAASLLRAHGLLFPANAHFHGPLGEAARGGSLLTGIGGDHVFATFPGGRALGFLSGHSTAAPRDILRLARFFSPWAFRGPVFRRRVSGPGWLRPAGRRRLDDLAADEERSKPRRWDRWIGWLARRRIFSVVRETYDAVGVHTGSRIEHPLIDTGFLRSLARAGGALGWGDRTHTLTALFSELLPRSALERSSKATFDGAFWGPESRHFAAEWDGGGVDNELVDPEALKREWNLPRPDARSSLLLQHAWLAAQPAEPEPVT